VFTENFTGFFEASTSASVAIVAFFIPNFSVSFFNAVDNTFFGVIFGLTSFIFVIDSMSGWESGQEWKDSDWVDADGTLIVGIVAIASTAKTEGTLSVGSRVRNRPFLVNWVVFNSEFKFSQIKSNIGTLFGGRVSNFISDMRFNVEVELFNRVFRKNKVVSQNVDVSINVIFDSETFDFFLKINNNFKVHVASIMSDPVFTSVSLE
jgi:hypothetical protein